MKQALFLFFFFLFYTFNTSLPGKSTQLVLQYCNALLFNTCRPKAREPTKVGVQVQLSTIHVLYDYRHNITLLVAKCSVMISIIM
jgi:hypothetical protein